MTNTKIFANKKYYSHSCHICNMQLLCQTNNKGQIKFPLTCPVCEVKVYHKNLIELINQRVNVSELSFLKRWWKYSRNGWFLTIEGIQEESWDQ